MFAVVGLGNPGKDYEGTRHNVGFWVVEQLYRSSEQCSSWEQKGQCRIARVAIDGYKVLLIEPLAFMNRSGEASRPLIEFYKISEEKLVIVHDDLDLPCGVLRLRRGGSAAGHRGVGDMLRHLPSPGFVRVRIGIGRPSINPERSEARSQFAGTSVTDWVLGEPGPEEEKLLEDAVSRAAEAVICLISQGLQEAQNRFHRAGPAQADS